VEEQPKWHAGVKACEVVARPDARTTLVKQVVRWSFLALRGDFALQLSMREAPHARTITTEMTQVRAAVRGRTPVCVCLRAAGRRSAGSAPALTPCCAHPV
jgi:hypothetical protein